MLRMAIRFVTLGSLAGALALSVWWWSTPGTDWLQAPSQTLALLAALSGIPADRWAAAAERRGRTLRTVERRPRLSRLELRIRRVVLQRRSCGGRAGVADQGEHPGDAAVGLEAGVVLLDLGGGRPSPHPRQVADELDVGEVAGGKGVELAAAVEAGSIPSHS